MNPRTDPRPSVLSRLPWLLAMQALMLVILAYPLFMKEAWLVRWVGGWEARAEESWLARLALSELEPLITFHFSPLILKGVMASGGLVFFLAVLLAGRFLRAFAPGVLPDWRPTLTGQPLRAFAPWLIAMLWMAASAFWSPTPHLSRAALPWLLLFGLFGYTLLRRGLRIDETRQLAVLMMGLGAIVALLSLIQAIRPFGGAVFNFFHKFDDPRNAYGSLMGHNTAVGNFLLMTLFPALAFVGGEKRRARWIAGAYAALALFAMLVVQSRAVWLIAPVLIAVYIARGSGWSGRTVRRTGGAVLALAALAVLSQAIPASWNPLYLEERPVARRLRDLSFERLQKESRLRLFVCSLPLLAERPLPGHGLYAFQYVYPKVQGDYFARHPDSSLGFTNKRSHMAHNEYLQVAVEQGFIGLILFLVALGEVARRGWKARDGLPDDHRALHAAFGFSALGLALGAGVDFPFHIPQLVLPWMFCLAAFASVILPSNEAASPARPQSSDAAAETSSRRFRVDRVFGLSLSLIILFLVPIANYHFVQTLAVDTRFLHASSFLSSIRKRERGYDPERALSAIQSVIQQLRHVVLVEPSHGHARLLLGEAHYTLGRTLAETAAPTGRLSEVVGLEIARAHETAIQYVEQSIKTLRTHHSFYVLALCYRSLAQMAPPERQEELLEAHARHLETSVHFAPGYGPALYLLAEYLAAEPEPDRERIAAYRRSIRRHDPGLFRRHYLSELNARIEAHDWIDAAHAVEAMLEIDAADPGFLNLALYVHLHDGGEASRARLLALCDLVGRAGAGLEPPGPAEALLVERVHLYRHLARREWKQALRWIEPFAPDNPNLAAWLRAVEVALLEELDLERGVAAVSRPEPIAPGDWERRLLEMRLLVESRVLRNSGAAGRAIEARLQLSGEPGAGFWADVVEWAHSAGETERYEEARVRLRALAPAHSLLPENESRGPKASADPSAEALSPGPD